MAKLKVFGGQAHVNHCGFYQQRRVVIASTSRKRAAELVGLSDHYLKNYWSITGNPIEVPVALANPDTVLVCSRQGELPPTPLKKEKP